MDNLINLLAKECQFIFNNEKSFIEAFCKGDVWIFKFASFCDEYINFGYILDCGQHLTDTIRIEDYINWKKELTQQSN